MRFTVALFSAPIFAVAACAVTLPDEPDPALAALAQVEAAALFVAFEAQKLGSAGQSAAAAKALIDFQARLGAEMAARQAQCADLSVTALSPWVSAQERSDADTALEAAIPRLHALSWQLTPFLITQPDTLERSSAKPSTEISTRAKAYQLIQGAHQGVTLGQIAQSASVATRREAAASLRQRAMAEQALDDAVAQVRALPPAAPEVARFAATLTAPEVFPLLLQETADTFALDAVFSELIDADPANAAHWLARGRVRYERGWRRGAVGDYLAAAALTPQDPALAPLRQLLEGTPGIPASVWQEFVSAEAAMQVITARTLAQLAGEEPAPLAAPSERAARAATRNRARRFYACSFIGDPTERAAALQWVGEHHAAKSALFPVLAPDIINAFSTEARAANGDAGTLLRVHHRYAPLFGGTEFFWRAHVALFLRARHAVAASAAFDAAAAAVPQAEWLPAARSELARLLSSAKPAAP